MLSGLADGPAAPLRLRMPSTSLDELKIQRLKRILREHPGDSVVMVDVGQGQVLKLAEQAGWKAYHTFDSRRSEPGWPDLVLVRGVQLIFLELKTEEGVVSDDQEEWIDKLGKVKRVAASVARPHHWERVKAVLTSRAR